MHDVYMGTLIKGWMPHLLIKYVTFNVTDDCNLSCKYCYFTHKDSHNKMSFDIAKKAIDYILEEKRFDIYDGIVWDFIGGEPSLEAKLIDEICDYILEKMFQLNHKWLNCYKFMMCTNGILYTSSDMQRLVQKHGINFQISITIDGNKEKHDLSRIKKDGSGSYDDVIKNLPLWLQQQGLFATKSTFAHQDLPYLKDSIINLWNLGIVNVMANVVFEDVWSDGDDLIFEEQLRQLADYVIENELWEKYSVRFFDPKIGMPLPDSALGQNYCGAGQMLAIGTNGKYYPCMRFMPSALNNQKALEIGDVDHGIDFDKIRSFYALNTLSQSDQECLQCEVSSGCSWCTGFNYDSSDIGTIFERKKYICKMHKANVRAAKYFWLRYENVSGEISPYRVNRLQNPSSKSKHMYIITGHNKLSHCQYCISGVNLKITTDLLDKAIEYCENNDYIPVFLGMVDISYQKYGYIITDDLNDNDSQYVLHILTHEIIENSFLNFSSSKSLIYKINKDNMKYMVHDINKLISSMCDALNISIFIENLRDYKLEDLFRYGQFLQNVADLIFDCWKCQKRVNINVLTHILFLDSHKNCGIGNNNITLGPDGKFYICPAFYYDLDLRNKYQIGDLNTGVKNNYQNSTFNINTNLCGKCDNYHCDKCVYMSLLGSGEFCVPTEIQCIKTNIERQATIYLLNKLKEYEISFWSYRKELSSYRYLDMLLNTDVKKRVVTNYGDILKGMAGND